MIEWSLLSSEFQADCHYLRNIQENIGEQSDTGMSQEDGWHGEGVDSKTSEWVNCLISNNAYLAENPTGDSALEVEISIPEFGWQGN